MKILYTKTMTTFTRFANKFTPAHYELALNIDRKQRSFTGKVMIDGKLALDSQEISLHSKDLSIEKVTVDGSAAAFEFHDYDELRLLGEYSSEVQIAIEFSGKITDAMHGMYPCYFEYDGVKKELIATQFESHHAREVFPCVDEPAAKATFDVTLTTENDVVVLGNMPTVSQKSEDDRLITTFDTTPKMSAYLLAWVYGELHAKSGKTNSGVEVNVWATPAQKPESLDFALDHAIKTIEFFDNYFGTTYPLPKSDHVALPDFAAGAMENWGLITYREVALLADPASTTVASKQYIATVVSHELSHQWFGNLVTMKWWNNLWLNESFATIMEYIAVDAIHPEWNIWLDFATHESVMALRRDAIDGVQAVQVDVENPDEISSLFDGAIVYAKGARLMRMCQSFIGHEAFRRGLASYFAEFAYGNTEADDLWRHLSEASGQDIASLMNTWISQPGYPVVSVDDNSVSQTQFFIGEHEPSQKLWPIPLMAESTEDVPALLETRHLALPITPGERLNADDNAHFITHYAPHHLSAILTRDDLSTVARLQLLDEQTLLIRGGLAQSDSLIDLLQNYTNETSQAVWDVMSLAISELKKFVETDEAAEKSLRKLSGDLARPLFEKLGWEAKDGEPEDTTKLRSTILGLMTYSDDPEVLAHLDELFAQGVENIDAELRTLVISSVARRSTDFLVIQQLFELHKTTSSADLSEDICIGITSVKQPDHINCLLEQMTDVKVIRPQDNARWFVYLIRNRYARGATWNWMRDNWGWIEKTFGGDKSYDYYPRYAASGLTTREQLAEFREFFTPLRDQPALTRVIDLGINEIQARIELLERDGDAVREKLLSL